MKKESILVFDTETTGLPPKKTNWKIDYDQYPHIVQFAWWFDGVYYDRIIKPDGWIIPKEATEIHGITQEQAEKEGLPFATVVDEFLGMALTANKIIAHNIYFDSSMIKANVMRMKMEFFMKLINDALDKDKRVCTMMKTIKFVQAEYPDGRKGKFPKLEELYAKLFDNATFNAHDAKEDVKATLSCYNKLVVLGILD